MQLKIFQIVRQNFVLIYFNADQHWLSIQILINIVKCILTFVLQSIFLFYVADTPEEVMSSIFMLSVGILVFVSFMSTIRKVADIFHLMDRVEHVVDKSELAN